MATVRCGLRRCGLFTNGIYAAEKFSRSPNAPRLANVPSLMLRLLFLLFLTHAALALEIKEIRWGFDGKAIPNRFNLLSVLVAQEGGTRPFDGDLSLLDTRGGEMTYGAPLVQPLYLSPGTQRWVQFVPFVGHEQEWRLAWGKDNKLRAPVMAPKFGPPATTLLRDATSVFVESSRFSTFPEDLFPTSVAATDGLDQIVLDHIPRWDAPRREAFLDWLRRGGIVHLLRGPEGHPRFVGEFAELNVPANQDKTRVGAGRVVRHDMERAEVDEAFLKNAGYPLREFRKLDGSEGRSMLYDFDETLLQNLASLTKPEVQWWLLYLLTLAYLALIGPVHYVWSRKVDWRLALGGFLGTVAVFALAFIISGHRGSGEKQTSHSLAIAHSLGGDRWDVQQWVSAFATKGDFYKLTHAASANFYAIPSDNEAVNARAFGGKDGHLDADIPLYSSRPFLHRAVLTGPKADVTVSSWTKDSIVIELPESIPGKITSVHARWLAEVRVASVEKRKVLLANLGAPSTTNLFDEQKLHAMRQFQWANRNFDPQTATMPLLAHALRDVNVFSNTLTPRPLPPDHLQLFLFTEAPESFAMKGKGFDHGEGHVLYVIDVFRPDEAKLE